MPERQQDQLSGSAQDNALTLAAFSEQYHVLVRGTVPPELYSTFLYRDVAARIYAFIDQFHKPPRLHLPDLVEDLLTKDDEKAKSLRLLLRSLKELGGNLNEEWAVKQLNRFVRQQQLKLGVVELVEAIEHEDLDRAERVLQETLRIRATSFERGLTLDEAYKRIGQNELDPHSVLPTGIPELDHYGQGPARKQLWAVLAPFKRGKTWMLLHLARQALLHKWRVLYISLEMEDQILAQRLLQSLFSLSKREEPVRLAKWREDEDGRLLSLDTEEHNSWANLENERDVGTLGQKLKRLRQRGNFLVKQFPTSQLTHDQLLAYLDGLEAQYRFVPDLLVLDYPKLMRLDPRNLRLELGAAHERLRGLGIERNIAVAIAAQVNREGVDAVHGRESHTAEDISLLGTCDVAVWYNQTPAEEKLGLARLWVGLGRNDRSRYSVLITQAYSIGQFCIKSRMLTPEYWMLLKQHGGGNDSDRSEQD